MGKAQWPMAGPSKMVGNFRRHALRGPRDAIINGRPAHRVNEVARIRCPCFARVPSTRPVG
eukprot:8323147-Lingulodinium_polyedra.AAC.1